MNERRDARRIARHGSVDRAQRGIGITGQREDESADPRHTGVAFRRQGRERLQRDRPVATDREAEREPAPRFLTVDTADRGPVIGLCLGLAAEQIVGKPAVATDGRQRRAELQRAGEIRQRCLSIAVQHRDRAHAGLWQRAARIDLVGASEEAGGRLRVA